MGLHVSYSHLVSIFNKRREIGDSTVQLIYMIRPQAEKMYLSNGLKNPWQVDKSADLFKLHLVMRWNGTVEEKYKEETDVRNKEGGRIYSIWTTT